MLRLRQALLLPAAGAAAGVAAEIERIKCELAASGLGGGDCTRRLTDATDLVITSAFEAFAPPEARGLWAVFATAGYGRRELCPHSSVPVLLLTGSTGNAADDWLAGWLAFLGTALPAASIHKAHVDELGDLLAASIPGATALLEARCISSNRRLREQFEAALVAYFSMHAPSFIAAKTEEAAARHARQGNTVYRAHPDLKEAPGALRDLQTIGWVGKALRYERATGSRLARHPLLSAADLGRTEAAADYILRMRFLMHHIAGRKEDIVRPELRDKLAALAGIGADTALTAGQSLMHLYYAYAADVHRLTRVLLRSHERVAGAAHRKRTETRRTLRHGFASVGGNLYATSSEPFAGREPAVQMLRAFRLAQRLHLSVADELQKRMHDNLWRIDDEARRDKQAAALFLEILATAGSVEPMLRTMRDAGFLATYIPEFGAAQGLVPDDRLHECTVDEHTLLAAAALDALVTTDTAVAKRRLLEKLPHPELLHLALICHDLGKAKGAGYVERSAVLVPQIAGRLGLSEEASRLVALLVANQLLLAATSLTRNLNDEVTIREVAAAAGRAETLDYLYLMSYADGVATGASNWPAWKDELLWTLYEKVGQMLLAAKPAASAAEPHQRVLEMLTDDTERRDAQYHLELVPPRYLVEVAPEEIVRHLRLVRDAAAGQGTAVAYAARGPLVHWWIVTSDRPGRISEIAGALAAHTFNIVSAQAYTRKDRVILDHFVAAPPDGLPAAEACRQAHQTLLAVLAGGANVAELLARRRRPARATHAAQPIVFIDNRISEDYSVIDITAPDRIGLLYEVAGALRALGLDIHFARIANAGDMATDVFFVTECSGRKISDAAELARVQQRLVEVLSGGDGGASPSAY